MARAKKPTTPRPTKEPGANGAVPKPRRQRQPKSPKNPTDFQPGNSRVEVPEPEPRPPINRATGRPEGSGRIASEIRHREVLWYVADLIPSRELTFVVGAPQSGKSSLGAWLVSQSDYTAILPGHEECVESMLLPRLLAAGANLDGCSILDDRRWQMPEDRQPLTMLLQRYKTQLLWIDPIDSYLSVESENDGQAVREALESFARLARDVGCAVVAARHPGKAIGNLCPGSRQWRAVPRVIVELGRDEGPPVRHWLRLAKDPHGRGLKPREFNLLGDPGEAKQFKLGPELAEGELAIMSVADDVERTLIDQGMKLLTGLLTEQCQDTAWVRSVAQREGIEERTLRRAAKRLGVIIHRRGTGVEHKSCWRLPSTPDTGQAHTHTPDGQSDSSHVVSQ